MGVGKHTTHSQRLKSSSSLDVAGYIDRKSMAKVYRTNSPGGGTCCHLYSLFASSEIINRLVCEVTGPNRRCREETIMLFAMRG